MIFDSQSYTENDSPPKQAQEAFYLKKIEHDFFLSPHIFNFLLLYIKRKKKAQKIILWKVESEKKATQNSRASVEEGRKILI